MMEEKLISEGLQNRLAMTPAMMKIIATSPAVMGGYLSFSMALASGELATPNSANRSHSP